MSSDSSFFAADSDFGAFAKKYIYIQYLYLLNLKRYNDTHDFNISNAFTNIISYSFENLLLVILFFKLIMSSSSYKINTKCIYQYLSFFFLFQNMITVVKQMMKMTAGTIIYRYPSIGKSNSSHSLKIYKIVFVLYSIYIIFFCKYIG